MRCGSTDAGMYHPLEFFIGSRYLKVRGKTHFVAFISLISTLGITVGVATLIVVLSVMNGFETEFRERILSVVSHATLEGLDGRVVAWPAVSARAMKNPAVVASAPYVQGEGMLLGAEDFAGVVVRGVEPVLENGVADFSEYLQAGEMEVLEPGAFRIFLGGVLAERLGVAPGDQVVLMVAQGNVTPAGIMPRMRRFEVAGLFNLDMYEYDSRMAIINIEDAARLYRLRDAVTGVRLKLDNLMDAPAVVREVAVDLGGGFYVSDWTRQNANFFRSIKLTKTVMFIMLLMVVAVAAFNIVSTLMMVIKDKQSDIAILRTAGASPAQIMRTFMVQGCLIGVTGTLLGLLTGVLLAMNAGAIVAWLERTAETKFLAADVYFISSLPSQIRAADLVLICTTALALALLSTLYPAWRAARTRPADALRYE